MEVRYHPKSLKEFYHLKALITLEQVNTSVVENNLNEPNFHGEANWSSVVNFHCMQMSLVMSMRRVFLAMIEMIRHVFALWQWCHFSQIEARDFIQQIRKQIVKYNIKLNILRNNLQAS